MASLLLRSTRNALLRQHQQCFTAAVATTNVQVQGCVQGYTQVRSMSDAAIIPGVGKGKTSTGLVSLFS